VSVAPAGKPAEGKPVEIAGGVASFAQDKYPAAAALDEKPETGWAIGPFANRPATADFFFKTPQGAEGGSIFTVTLEHQASAVPLHALGHFRISVTTAAGPDAADGLPANIQAILKVPAANRNEQQKNDLAAYHRRVAASLKPVRSRLAELRAVTPDHPLVAKRGQAGYIPVAINRTGAFASGDVQVTLEGFTLGRNADGPLPIARSLKLTPLTVAGDNAVGALAFTVEGNAETGTRLVVLRAEAKVGNDTFVQYSPAFPLTIN
jgi:hypothetical protein